MAIIIFADAWRFKELWNVNCLPTKIFRRWCAFIYIGTTSTGKLLHNLVCHFSCLPTENASATFSPSFR